jgi:hypothetical protein
LYRFYFYFKKKTFFLKKKKNLFAMCCLPMTVMEPLCGRQQPLSDVSREAGAKGDGDSSHWYGPPHLRVTAHSATYTKAKECCTKRYKITIKIKQCQFIKCILHIYHL